MDDFPLMSNIPPITTEQMREVDRLMIEEYGIALLQMMENAGRCLAHLARQRYLGQPQGRTVVVLAGTGGNGGGALVAARRLHNYGAKVIIYTTREMHDFTPTAKHQLQILLNMGVDVHFATIPDTHILADIILDGIIGYSLRGAPRGTAGELIHFANQHPAPTLALDTPSGLDTTTGIANEPTINADATLTLALPKRGLLVNSAVPYVGQLYLGDISIPPQLYSKLGLEIGAIFAQSDIVKLSH